MSFGILTMTSMGVKVVRGPVMKGGHDDSVLLFHFFIDQFIYLLQVETWGWLLRDVSWKHSFKVSRIGWTYGCRTRDY